MVLQSSARGILFSTRVPLPCFETFKVATLLHTTLPHPSQCPPPPSPSPNYPSPSLPMPPLPLSILSPFPPPSSPPPPTKPLWGKKPPHLVYCGLHIGLPHGRIGFEKGGIGWLARLLGPRKGDRLAGLLGPRKGIGWLVH